jgi:hypothetical protein
MIYQRLVLNPTLRMRLKLSKHDNLMLRSERRERLEAWAAIDSPILYKRTRFVDTWAVRSSPCEGGGDLAVFRHAFRPCSFGLVSQRFRLELPSLPVTMAPGETL